MTYKEAALIVLEASGKPMTAAEITAETIKRGLIKPAGKTPVFTMMGVLYTQEGESSPIKRIYSPGKTRAARGTVRWVLNQK